MSRRTLLILLFVSLALNLFALGLGVGAAHWRPHGVGGHGRGGGMGAVGHALSPEHRQAWRELMRAQGQGGAAELRQSRLLRRGAMARLGAEPVEAPAILADLERSRTLEAAGRADLDQKIVSFAQALPADERARFAEALLQPRGSGGGGPRQRNPGLAHR